MSRGTRWRESLPDWRVARDGRSFTEPPTVRDLMTRYSALALLGVALTCPAPLLEAQPTRAGEITVTATVDGFAPLEFFALGQEQLVDPTNDTFETAASNGLVAPDITRVTVWPDAGSLNIEIEFTTTVVSDMTGGPNVVTGFLDIDADQNSATGDGALTDLFRPGGTPTGLGVDFGVIMLSDPSGNFGLVDVANQVVTTFTPIFAGNLLTLRIPRSQLGGDDGLVDLATVVGTNPEPTDIAPNNGSIELVPGGPDGERPAPRCSLSWPPSREALLRRGGCD